MRFFCFFGQVLVAGKRQELEPFVDARQKLDPIVDEWGGKLEKVPGRCIKQQTGSNVLTSFVIIGCNEKAAEPT